MGALTRVSVVLLACTTLLAGVAAQEGAPPPETFRFRSGVELINVTATVTDGSGRFVSGLRQEDFRVYEDGRERPITHFTSERVPVSLGIVLDTSGSMEGERMVAAMRALQRFLFDLLGPEDEVFLYRFDTRPVLLHGWTTDRERVAAELRRIRPRGSTSLYDAIAEAIPMASTGKNRKKAVLVISDGNDTSSFTRAGELKKLIRESEVLVYAIGIDSLGGGTSRRWGISPSLVGQPPVFEQRRPGGPTPRPFPIPGIPQPGPGGPRMPPRYPTPPPRTLPPPQRGEEPVNAGVLRGITDDSGGRTEIIRQAYDLDPATAGIADELSKQYFLGYPADGVRDGRWRSIRVEVDRPGYLVRARRGYVASP